MSIVELEDEIRINESYCHLLYSKFKDNLDSESEKVVKRKTIFTTDYLKRLESYTNNLILPPNCRYIERYDKSYIVLIEEPPTIRSIRLCMDLSYELQDLRNKDKLEEYGYHDYTLKSNGKNKLSLAFPYVIFILSVDQNYYSLETGKVFVRPTPIRGLADTLYKVPLTNIASDQQVCFGDGIYKQYTSLSASINYIITNFWSSTFNNDYIYNYEAYANVPILNSYLEWQHMSKINPLFVYNADWILHKKNLYDEIATVKRTVSRKEELTLGFSTLKNLFFKPQDSGITTALRNKRKYKLLYDVAEYMHLNRFIKLNVGDNIQLKNGNAYIISFVGILGEGKIRYIFVYYNTYKLHMRLTQKLKNFLIDKIIEQQKQSITLSNGTKVKVNDILVIEEQDQKMYYSVSSIRQSLGESKDIFEVKLGSDYYFSNAIDAKKFNIDDLTVNGISINKDIKYFISLKHNKLFHIGNIYKYYKCSSSLCHMYVETLFKRVNTNKENILKFRLNDLKNNVIILPVEDMKQIRNIFRVHRTLLKANTLNRDNETNVWSYNGRIFHTSDIFFPDNGIDVSQVINNGIFKIQGNDFDTTFEIGDQVVVADWSNPLEVFNIKTIVDFRLYGLHTHISFLLKDKNNKLSEVQYVNSNAGHIYTGRIRKVTNNFEDLVVGTKIIAKETKIPAFPKRDVNIVVAIIIDGSTEPLVLCSNGCTLWYSTVMEKFELISPKSRKWKTLQPAPLDLSKIKYQPGDIVRQSSHLDRAGYLIAVPYKNKTPKAIDLGSLSFINTYTLNKQFVQNTIFDSIPNPRLSANDIEQLGMTRGEYDFHGGMIYENKHALYKFVNERGNINV